MMRYRVVCLLAVVALFGAMGGCAQKTDDLALVSGQWKSEKDGSPVTIDLAKSPKTIAYKQKTYPVTIQKVEGDRIVLEVEQEGGKKVVWDLVKAWEDNGKSFNLDLVRDNTKERLNHS